MKKNILFVAFIAAVAFAGTLSYTTSQLDSVIEMATDQTFMQLRDFTFEGVTSAGTDLLFTNSTASITSGALTTVTTDGVITVGRAGKLKLCMAGCFRQTAAPQSTDMELRIYLEKASGGTYTNTEYGVFRTTDGTAMGSFASSFHGDREVGDKIKIEIVSSLERDIAFDSVSVATSWME